MSESVRPSIPRPRPSRPPAPKASTLPAPRPSAPPPPVLVERSPARERLVTLSLEDGDIIGIAASPVTSPAPSPARISSVPPPPASRVRLAGSTAHAEAPSLGSPPARVASAGVPLDLRPRLSTEAEIELGWDDAAASVSPPEPMPEVSVSAVAPPPAIRAEPMPEAPAPEVAASSPASPAPARLANAEPAVVLRLSMNDPTDLIFDGMYGLTFARSRGEAAELCAETLAKALGARAVVIHAHDLVSRELRAIGAHGDGDFDIIGSAEPSDDDLVASAVICNQRSITMRFDGGLPRIAPKRLHAVGAPRTVVAAPAMAWGRCLAIIEVVDPDERYAARVADAASYVAERFAQFLSAHAA